VEEQSDGQTNISSLPARYKDHGAPQVAGHKLTNIDKLGQDATSQANCIQWQEYLVVREARTFAGAALHSKAAGVPSQTSAGDEKRSRGLSETAAEKYLVLVT